jgi:hypothetical protein
MVVTENLDCDSIKVHASDPSVTDYVWEVPAMCLQCVAEITEKTLVSA